MDETKTKAPSWPLRVYADPARARLAEALLHEKGLDGRIDEAPSADGPPALGDLAPGVLLVTSPASRAAAEAALAEADAATGPERIPEDDPECTACGSEVFAAVPPSEAPEGSWWLRCRNCGMVLPVAERTYEREEFPCLPSSCPACGSFLLEADAPPEIVQGPLEGRLWCVCEGCGHKWEANPEAKRPGTLAGMPVPVPLPVLAAPEAVPAEDAGAPSPGDDDADSLECPSCHGKDLLMNDSRCENEGTLRLMCNRCQEVWDLRWPAGEPLPDLPAIEDEAPEDETGRRCPQCQSAKTEPCETPPWAVESFAGRFFKAVFTGKTWRRCAACGHVWEG